uniref:Reelin domain-containing protein n=1 Tax=Oncorhynchus kisutch TaxID=8019 RepID=A0A8C7IZT2_ONCKI
MSISLLLPLWVAMSFSLTRPTLGFSRGASPASCLEMSPGHIRAQPQDPHHSHITLYTSASIYLPGDTVTVTVRSTRDFMGFLLQARSLGIAGRRGRGGRVAGTWTVTPPGTHTQRCLGDNDSLTHSDKQLKRNLSFVWRAPDTALGDIRFYITVVQSYFVYWARIESAVLHDSSRGFPGWGNATVVDRGSSLSELQEEVTTLTNSAATTITPDLSPSPELLSLSLGEETDRGRKDEEMQTSNLVAPLTTPSPSPHHKPSPAPRRSHTEPLTPPTPRAPPKPTPRQVPSVKDGSISQNRSIGPNPNPNTKTRPGAPGEGKIPDIVASQNAWELGILLGCASGLGMILAIGFRYLYSQYCNKRTGVTLNDRERDYDRNRNHGGLIHIQDCTDLVRIRRIRENSFVLLAEYNLLTQREGGRDTD